MRYKNRKFESLLNMVKRNINTRPVIILGNQKTGTSAVASLVGRAANATVTIDIRGICEPVFSNILAGRISYEDFVKKNRKDFSTDIIKEPALTFIFSNVYSLFPDATYGFIMRDPRDNIRSILNRIGVEGNHREITYDLIANCDPNWRGIVTGIWLEPKGDGYIDTLAIRWMHAAQVYSENASFMKLIKYEDFVSNKCEEIYIFTKELGLKVVNDISQYVDIQYQPPGDHSKSWLEFFGEENLAIIERRCASMMNTFAYPTSLL